MAKKKKKKRANKKRRKKTVAVTLTAKDRAAIKKMSAAVNRFLKAH